MSRGEDASITSRQNAARYLQFAESTRANRSGKKKGSDERKAQDQKTPFDGIEVPRQFSLQGLAKTSSALTEWPVPREEKSRTHTKQGVLTSFAPKMSRNKIAELFVLSSYGSPTPKAAAAGTRNKARWGDDVGGDGGAGHRHRSAPETASGEFASNKLHRLGASANADLVHAAVLNFKSLRKPERRALDTTVDDEMASTRGQNVSILQLREPADSWESPITSFSDAGGSLRSAPKIASLRAGCGVRSAWNFPGQHSADPGTGSNLTCEGRKRSEGSSNSITVFLSRGVNSSSSLKSANRELSPVRWCDREVDGVYLGRSGWVQVQQRSLDESKRSAASKGTVSLTSTLPNRMKLTQYHCNSEFGGEIAVRKDRPRPDYLPLAVEIKRDREDWGTPSPLQQDFDHFSPTCTTPIISPPLAFQDPGSQQGIQTILLSKNPSGKPPVLSRSKAVVDCDSPPSSPISLNWNSCASGSTPRSKRLTPSSASTPQMHPLQSSQARSAEDRMDYNTRKNHFHRFIESSTSSSSPSFVFRSLDGNMSRQTAMPKVNETDSSGDGYDDEDVDDAYRRSCSRTKSPLRSTHLDRTSAEPGSPNAFRYRSSQRMQTSKKTCSSERNGAKFGAISSSSESCSSCDRKSPRTNFRRFGQKQNHDVQNNPWEVRNSRVRRSRSLQLPEKRSPGVSAAVTQTSPDGSREHLSPDRPYYTNSKNGETKSDHDVPTGIPSGSHRVVLKLNGEAAKGSGRTRRFGPIKALSEEAKHEELKRESEEETRIITDYLNAARSRAAARDLLIHRFLNKPDEEIPARGSSIEREASSHPLQSILCGESNRRSSQKKAIQQRNADSVSNGYCTGNLSTSNPCSSSTCDFWPHCAHRDVIGQKKPSQSTTKLPLNFKSSQYYHKVKNLDHRMPENFRKDEKQEKESQIGGIRFSPETANNFETQKDSRRLAVSVGRSLESKHRSHSQESKKEPSRQDAEGGKGKFENLDAGKRRKDEFRRKAKYESLRHRDGSSSTSSSGDAHPAALDDTGKSFATRKTLPSSTPMDETASVSFKLSWDQEEKARGTFSPRPGSAPTNETDDEPTVLDAQRKSMSLPKSFLSEEYGSTSSRQSGLFPWRKQFLSAMAAAPASGLRPLTPETPKTAPATPVRDAGNISRDREKTKQMQYVRSSSTPLLDETPTLACEWEPRRELLQESATDESSSSKEVNSSNNQKKKLQGQRCVSGNQISESVLQKFKKSISLRFYKGQKNSVKDDSDEVDHLPEEGASDQQRQQQQQQQQHQPIGAEQKSEDGHPKEEGWPDQKYRLGPLVWRSSKERKKSKKAVRNAKCNSGDSGIQIENSLHLPGDSSESHDTDQQDELDSPPVMRRRGPSTEKSSRPQSEVINQVLIDKFKADLQWRAQTKGCLNRRVRRTNSDLGGQRLFNWELRNNCRRLTSLQSPAKGRTSRSSLKKSSPEGSRTGRNGKFLYRAALRRSVSQPLGLNELSPLMRRKASMARNLILSEDEQDGRGVSSDDEPLSDSESSVTSLNERKKSFEQAMDEEVVILAEAVWDHVAMEPEELAFRAGDVIEVLDTIDRDWWWGGAGDSYGWFPSAFVRLRVSQEDTVEDCLEAMASGSRAKSLRRRTSVSLLSNDQVRSSVVRELLNTERDFVKILRDVAEGYLAECRRRVDMFSSMQIEAIFSNIENLLSFQRKFLEDLEERVDKEAPHRSCVGETFLKHRSGFSIYSEYCNGHPMAIATLQELYQRSSYAKFFEACRLMRGLIEIPLDGYLLTPVQRICKYPLQLAELLKYTKLDHPDHLSVKEALETMREVAILINERKRRMESLEKLASWQQRVEGWEGEDLIEISTQLIYQGDVVRITSGMWTSNITMFLFDHQLVYCKKDLLKRNTYVYKGRIHTETSEIIDVPDGKDPHSGVTIRHGLKIYSCVKDKRLLICCRNGEEKSKWLEALAKERNLVAQDRESGLELPPAARQLARLAARSKRRPPNGPGGKIYKRESHYNGYRMGRKMGTWFTFGGAKKSARANLRTRNVPRQTT